MVFGAAVADRAQANQISSSLAGGDDGGGFFGTLGDILGNSVATLADFGTKLFVFDELNERRQPTNTIGNQVQQTATGNTAGTGGSSGSLIAGISNQTLLIAGVGVAVVLILLVKMK